eukprot:scaffold87093_cov25-Tisochrysis_lutea.AAC.5
MSASIGASARAACPVASSLQRSSDAQRRYGRRCSLSVSGCEPWIDKRWPMWPSSLNRCAAAERIATPSQSTDLSSRLCSSGKSPGGLDRRGAHGVTCGSKVSCP